MIEVRSPEDDEDEEMVANWCQVHRMPLTEEIRLLRAALDAGSSERALLNRSLEASEQEAADLREERDRLLEESNRYRLEAIAAREQARALAAGLEDAAPGDPDQPT